MNAAYMYKLNVRSSLSSTIRHGHAVSLNGSQTVSPTTTALWASDHLPPYLPVSMNFLALSHAPPPLLRAVAIRMPLIVPTNRVARLGFSYFSNRPQLNGRLKMLKEPSPHPRISIPAFFPFVARMPGAAV